MKAVVISLENRAAQIAPATNDAALRRLAVQIAAQLPAEPADALTALKYTETLVRSFLADLRPVLRPSGLGLEAAPGATSP